jgi:hypothetical protein
MVPSSEKSPASSTSSSQRESVRGEQVVDALPDVIGAGVVVQVTRPPVQRADVAAHDLPGPVADDVDHRRAVLAEDVAEPGVVHLREHHAGGRVGGLAWRVEVAAEDDG